MGGIAVLAALAASLLFLLPGGLVQAQDAIMYAENGTGPVATFTADDPEDSAIVSWTLDGADAGDFKIEDGVLNFKKAPDYETPKGGGEEVTDTDNIYIVTVQATDATKRIGKKDVTVEVTNVEEGGSMRLSAVQPQAGTSFYVIDEDDVDDPTPDVTDIKDEDGITSSIKWQWSRSMSKTTGFTDIDKATNAAYTPKDTDAGYYLRVTASYTDREGPSKSAQATASYPVQLAPSNNAAPKFADDQDPDTENDQEAADRSIAENTPKGVDIGSPIEASDLNPGKLTYTLDAAAAALFDIDRETGQLKTKGKLDADTTPTYMVTVRATDPSGDPQVAVADRVEDNSDTVTVNITVEDLDEDPQISDESIDGFAENDAIATALATFMAVTEDGTGTVSRWSLAGPDGSKFTIEAGALAFAKEPDYEKPGDADGDNMYEVTVRATDSDGRTGTKDVTVEVTNFDEPGAVTLSPTQHRVGVPITATLKDDDGGVYGGMWQWSIGGGTVAQGEISGANSATYTPKAGDIGGTLTATVTYRDAAGLDTDDSANAVGADAVLRDTRNKAPVFKDSKGVVITQAERSVAETATADMADDDADDDAIDNVGGTIMAEDPNIGTAAEGDSLAFSLSGGDASKFRVRQPVADATDPTMQNVQVEVKAGAKFDYETKDTYMVTLTATDDYGETAELELTINITDVNDAPKITGLGEVEYAENGTDELPTYTAVDPDGSEIVSWTLAGVDADDFKIEDGVLSFKKAPDYETPKGGGQDATDTDNIYMVTVQATDATKRVGTKEVTVEVTNVEEGGSMRLSAVQPQAGTSFYVIDEDEEPAVTNIKDPDEITSSIKWQWSKSRSKTRGFAGIDKATNAAYTPKDGDNGYYLRVTASYTDREGPSKSAQATASYPVQLAPSNNDAPKFADDQDPDTENDQEAADRSIAENTPKGVDIGSPIEASDLNPGKLTYTLEGTDDFDIDRETGQLKTKNELDADTTSTYEVTVRATDPSGDPQVAVADRVEDNSDTVTVNITVEDLDEDPQISDESIDGFAENDAIATALATFMAVTEDGTGTVSRWSLAGPDGSKFTIEAGALAFAKEPDYEKPGDADGDNMYEVTVRATDSDGRTGTKDVTVEVTNFDEPGAVTLSPTQHRVGVPITATLKDDDGGVYGGMWQWSIGGGTVAQGEISGTNSATYTPKAGDIGGTLTATVTYRDAAGLDTDDSANAVGADAVLRDTRNKAPVFKDSKGVVITQAERSVAETATADMADDDADDDAIDNVGGTIMAEDPNIGTAAEGDSLAFSLSGGDASKFRVRQPVADATDPTMQNVQVEVKAGAKFDYETKDTYMVTLTATDDYGETAELELTINITDVNDAPEIMAGGVDEAPDVAGEAFIKYEENATSMVATYTAVDPEGAEIVWSLGGDDAALFSIEGGMLTFKSAPDFEMAADMDGDNMYSVTVQATDETGNMGTKDVTVEVTNVDEKPDVAGEASIEYPENATSTVATYTAVDPEGAEIVWSLGGDDAALFSIEGGVLTFKKSPNFEMAADMDGDNMYSVTVQAADEIRRNGYEGGNRRGHRRERSAGCGRKSLHRIRGERHQHGGDLHGGGPRGCGDRVVAGWRRRWGLHHYRRRARLQECAGLREPNGRRHGQRLHGHGGSR